MKLQLGILPKSFDVLSSPSTSMLLALQSATSDISRHAAEPQDVVVTGFSQYVVRGRVTVALTSALTWSRNGRKVAPSRCAGVGIQSAVAAGLDRALGLAGEGGDGKSSLSIEDGGSLEPTHGVVPGTGINRVTRDPCPPRPSNVVKVSNKQFAVVYSFATLPLTLAQARGAMDRLHDHVAFSLAVVGMVNILDSRGFTDDTEALTAEPNLQSNTDGFPAADPLVDVLVRIPTELSATAKRSYASPSYASETVANFLRSSIQDGNLLKNGLETYGIISNPRFARQCSSGSCRDVLPAANLPPPSPPPPAMAAAAAEVELKGLTTDNFKEGQQKAFIAAMAKVAGVDPSAIKIKGFRRSKKKTRRRRKRKVNLSGRRLAQSADDEEEVEYEYDYDYSFEYDDTAEDGGGIVVDFEIETENAVNTDAVAAKIDATSPEAIVATLKEQPELSNITEAIVPPGSVTVMMPPSPPPTPAQPRAPPLNLCEKCKAETILTEPSGVVTDGSLRSADYAADADCTWIINPGRGPVTITFTFFDTEDGNDVVELFDGKNADTATEIGMFTGSKLPGNGESMTTKTNSAMVRFITDSTKQGKGWAMVYKSANATFVAVTGSVSLKGYSAATFGYTQKAGFAAVMAAKAGVAAYDVFVVTVEDVSSMRRSLLAGTGEINVTYTVKASDAATAKATETTIVAVTPAELYFDFISEGRLSNISSVVGVTDPVISGNPSSNSIGVGTGDGIADDSTAGDGSLGGGSLISPCKQTLRLRGTSGCG